MTNTMVNAYRDSIRAAVGRKAADAICDAALLGLATAEPSGDLATGWPEQDIETVWENALTAGVAYEDEDED